MAEWCQNKDCCRKRTQNQIRGSKGNKYYQSNKASGYYLGIACTLSCLNTWIKTNKETLINAVGEIGKQTIGVDDAWEFKHDRNYNSNSENEDMYFLINRLQGVYQAITREQAQTPDQMRQDYGWCTRGDSEAKPLAIQLGLAS